MTPAAGSTPERLPDAPCPNCETVLASDSFPPNQRGGAETATDFQSCLRRCEPCGIGLSNARHGDTRRLQKIDRDLLRGLPEELRAGCAGVLARALNEVNRPTKQLKFQSWGSEDQVTWVIFRYLQQQGRLRSALAAAGVRPAQHADLEPVALYWGTPVTGGELAAEGLRDRLVGVLDRLREDPQRYTEPDVILDFGPAGLVFFEIKLGAGNDTKPASYRRWGDYLNGTEAFTDPDAVLQSGLYQLARNWRAGWELAGERPFTLVNLGPARLSGGRCAEPLRDFERGLPRRDDRRFQSVTWETLLAGAGPLPDWLEAYLKLRGL